MAPFTWQASPSVDTCLFISTATIYKRRVFAVCVWVSICTIITCIIAFRSVWRIVSGFRIWYTYISGEWICADFCTMGTPEKKPLSSSINDNFSTFTIRLLFSCGAFYHFFFFSIPCSCFFLSRTCMPMLLFAAFWNRMMRHFSRKRYTATEIETWFLLVANSQTRTYIMKASDSYGLRRNVHQLIMEYVWNGTNLNHNGPNKAKKKGMA